MPLFKRLVEREFLEEDYRELHIFFKELKNQSFANDEIKMIHERDARIIDCYPFHEISMQSSRFNKEVPTSVPYRRLKIENPTVAGFAKLK
jgi:hypothetical protein